MFSRWLLSIVASTLPSTAFAENNTETERGITFFETEVRPILVEQCYECHSGKESKGGLRVDKKDPLLAGGDSGKVLIPGDPRSSLLAEAIRYKNADLRMPPDSPLKAREVEAIEKWIEMGAPDPRTGSDENDANVPMGMSIEVGRAFWSFQPISDPPIPSVKNPNWPRTPLDAFVLAKLEANGLVPSPPADKRTLIRRVTFDLTGLPPSPDEIKSFLDDESEDAFSKVVERLLQSPRYGVRWGRHWLDVARYADSNGLDENLAFGNAWRYRDYVVEAFTRDKPFDRFIIEQIAGDLLPDANLETKIATGFLVLGAKVLAEPDQEKLEMDTIDEQLDTLGKVFWGMTLGCVRCHDHKFDPLKQSDYYAMAAILKSTKTFGETRQGAIHHWHEIDFANKEEAEQIKSVEVEIAATKKTLANFKQQAIVKARADARDKAADYLVAAAQLSPDCSLFDAEAVASRNGLNAHVLHHCCRFLHQHADDTFVGEWNRCVATGDIEGIRSHYDSLFRRVEEAVAEAKKAGSKSIELESPELEQVRKILYDGVGFLAIPSKPNFAFDSETLEEYRRLAERVWVTESRAPDSPSAMSVADGQILNSLPIHIRGSHRNLGAPIYRSFPAVMMVTTSEPILPRDESGRLELAQWMASPSHPLTARVYANRLWRWHFGTGLVRSTENFGAIGDPPSHPELLDWLARYLIESNWSTKAMHRLIVTSSTYQMSSEIDLADAMRHDPDNRLLWKFPRQRLEAEQIRDSLLAVAGLLDESMSGKSIPLRNRQFVFDHTSTDRTRYDSHRRSIYIPIIRNHLYGFLEQFDFPDPTMPTGSRNQTTIPSQALLLMNSDLVLESSDAMADKLIRASSDSLPRIELAHELVYGRPASPIDIQLASEYLSEFKSSASQANSSRSIGDERMAWSLYCQSLLASNEFIFVR